MSQPKQVAPGGTIGVLGSGQLGRMFAMVAARLGYRVVIYSPESDSPAGQVADREIVADYDDPGALREFARLCDVVTLEFENIPVQAIDWVSEVTNVYPGKRVLEVSQDRIIEKQTLADAGLPVTAFRPATDVASAQAAAADLGGSVVLKTARSGYDGKGQRIVHQRAQIPEAIESLDSDRLIVEQLVDFGREVSVLVYRDQLGNVGTFPLIENHHVNHILDHSICPAQATEPMHEQAQQIAFAAAECLHLVGLLCVEMFVQHDDRLLINELAPRPHNSGHLTIEAFACCQFQQLLRCICGLPLVRQAPIRPAAMVNLLGDLWEPAPPDFAAALALEDVSLHLYGKQSAQPGRKMGHITATANTAEQALQKVLHARDLLR